MLRKTQLLIELVQKLNTLKKNPQPKSPLRSSRLETNLAKSILFKARMLYNTMVQKLKVLKMALIRRDIASDIAVCKWNIINLLKALCVGVLTEMQRTNLKRSKRLHGEELGGPQLKV